MPNAAMANNNQSRNDQLINMRVESTAPNIKSQNLKLRKKVYTIRRKKKHGDTNAATLDTFSLGSGGDADHNMIPS